MISVRVDHAPKPYDRRLYWEHVISEVLAVVVLVAVFILCGVVW